MNTIYRVSSLAKTWILDLDGTIVKHNGYKLDGHDTLLEGAREFFAQLNKNDMVIFVTSRSRNQAPETEQFLREQDISFHAIIYDAPYGERILINDEKPSGLPTAIAINTTRDIFHDVKFEVDALL